MLATGTDRSFLPHIWLQVWEETIQTLVDGRTPLFEKSSGVMFISDPSVVRLDKFIPEE